VKSNTWLVEITSFFGEQTHNVRCRRTAMRRTYPFAVSYGQRFHVAS